jgi:cyclophilin family peptidyl-prolyl cis-trans isomerase
MLFCRIKDFVFRCVLVLFLLVFIPVPIRAGTLVQFRTVFGDIEVELYDQDKPVTVQNFLNYIQSGRYQNEFSHRLVPNFVVQGGGFTLTTNVISAIPTYPPITNEFSVGQKFSNVYGTIAMAKLGGDTNSATSQWFFNLTNNAFLDAPDTNNFFVVFGHVIQGTNVLNVFNQFMPWTGNPAPAPTNLVLTSYFSAPLNTLPVLSSNFPPTSSSFVFIDITLLQVAIQPVAGGQQISWNSATGLTNYVEFTTNFPPVWNTLFTTNGTGSRMAIVDAAASPNRFYRVRVAN